MCVFGGELTPKENYTSTVQLTIADKQEGKAARVLRFEVRAGNHRRAGGKRTFEVNFLKVRATGSYISCIGTQVLPSNKSHYRENKNRTRG